jgi:proteic killer suppression protein
MGKVERILTALDSAVAPQALDIPGYRLHPLKGEWKGFWSGDGADELAHRFSV